jgi:predicted AAA+ superfamily ATPase
MLNSSSKNIPTPSSSMKPNGILPCFRSSAALSTVTANEKTDFYQLFQDPLNHRTAEFIKSLKSHLSHDQLMEMFLKGGYPEPLLAEDVHFYDSWMENYVQTYVQRDIRTLFPRLDMVKYQRFVSMLAAPSGTILNRSQIGRSLDISEKAIRDYLQIAAGSYIWRNIPSYEKSISKSVVKMPKGNIRDSGLAHFLQGNTRRRQLLTYPQVGATFEAFVFEEIIKGIQSTTLSNWHYFYFRTKNGAEIDMSLAGPFGILPIEIKFGSTIKPNQLQSMKALVYKNDLQ